MTDNKDIDAVLNSNDSPQKKDALDINADTETMNKQLENHMKKLNDKNDKNDKNNKLDEQPQKLIKIDKDMLKTLIIEWLSLDDQIKVIRDAAKEKTDEKKQYESQILELMNALDQEIILTDKGNITKNVKASKGPLTPELIKTTLTDILKSAETAETYTNHILEKRTTRETVALKRKEFEAKRRTKCDKKVPIIKKKVDKQENDI